VATHLTDRPGATTGDPARRRRRGERGERGRLDAGLAGVVAAVAAMAAAELVALLTGPGSVPVVAVGTAVVPLVPEPVKQAAIAAFGTSDKTALLIGTCILLAAAAFGFGLAARHRPAVGDAGIVLFAGIGALSASRAGVGGTGSVLPSLAAAVVGVVVLRGLLTRVRTAGPSDSAVERRPSRRAVLATLGATAAGALAVGAAGLAGMRLRFGSDSARAALRLPVPASPAPAQPAGVDPGAVGALPFRTPNADFYRIDTALFVPHIEPGTWRLRIHGMVGRELTIDLPTLLRRPMVERDITLACVSNPVGGSLVGNARWLGVPLAPLLAEVGISPDADQLVSRDSGGTSIGTPIATVTDGRDALLAVGMNGEPLPFEHGFPVRMVVPGLYGYVSACKWITDIEVTRFDAYDAYWVRRGWAPRGPVKVSSRIDTPRDGHRRPAGPGVVAGVAWAQHTGIARVEVRVDDGPWAQADLAPAATADTWRLWTWPWNAPAGEHALTVRAVTTAGQVQTADRADTVPDGATGLHTVRVAVTG